MSNPLKGNANITALSKLRAMVGKDATSVKHSDYASTNKFTLTKKTGGAVDVAVVGRKEGGRLDRAHGGRTKKGGNTTVNVIVPPHKEGGGAPMPMPPPGGLPPPPPPMAKPPMPPGGMPPPGLGGGMPPGAMMPPPGGPPGMGGPPPMRARGGQLGLASTKSAVTADHGMSKDANRNKAMVAPIGKAKGGYISGEAPAKLSGWAGYAKKNSYHKKQGGGISGFHPKGGADTGVGRMEYVNYLKGKNRNKD